MQSVAAGIDRYELRQIIAGLSEGVIRVEPNQTIAYANEAALAIHGAGSLDEIGPTVDAYRERFRLRYRNKVAPQHSPIERVVAGEHLHDVVVEVRRPGRPEQDSVHSLPSLVSAERIEIEDEPFVVLVMRDITDRKRTVRELFGAIETAMAATSWFNRGLIEKLTTLRRPDTERPDAVASHLTARERQILNLICSGLDDETIARKLDLSRNTVRNHEAALCRKLGIHKRGEAIVWGRGNGFSVSSGGTHRSFY